MSSSTLPLELNGAVALLRLDRPPVNAIDLEFLRQLNATLDRLASMSEARALVITGAGTCFSAGLDLKHVERADAAERKQLVLDLNSALRRLYAWPMPVVVAINGHAIAGGLVVALTADYRIVTTDACTIALSEVRVGIPFPAGALAIVQGELSARAQRRLGLLGTKLDQGAALDLGVLDESQEPQRLLPRALDIAREFSSLPASAFGVIKRQLRASALAALDATIATHHDPMLDAWRTDESDAASASVLSRKPR